MWYVRVPAPLAVVVVFLFAFYELMLFTHEIYVASFVISFHLFTQANNRKTNKIGDVTNNNNKRRIIIMLTPTTTPTTTTKE